MFWLIALSAFAVRLVFLAYGQWQDANSVLKYTDIDYFVFTDAAEFIFNGKCIDVNILCIMIKLRSIPILAQDLSIYSSTGVSDASKRCSVEWIWEIVVCGM